MPNRAVGYELFLLTVPIEEVARCQYKTVQIIFPLNLQTITITLDVVKWKGGSIYEIEDCTSSRVCFACHISN